MDLSSHSRNALLVSHRSLIGIRGFIVRELEAVKATFVLYEN